MGEGRCGVYAHDQVEGNTFAILRTGRSETVRKGKNTIDMILIL